MAVNQAVVFTKPLHPLGIPLTPEQLGEETRTELEARGLQVVSSRRVTGPELAQREAIRHHYLMYSRASYGLFTLSDAGRIRFAETFGRDWNAEVQAGRIMGNPQLMASKGIDASALFTLWSAATVQKIQSGLLMARLDALDCYCINAFYPAMEANFYHPRTTIFYYVVEFDPARVSWKRFRKEILGATDASKADPASFRGRLYARYPVAFPGRDNFVHGSAGPFEGLVERAIHEPAFDLQTNPVGRHLAQKGVTLASLGAWKARQAIADLGALFDATEEQETDEVLPILDAVADLFQA